MKVCVIGLGYIGLPTAAVLASRGIDVIGVDVNQYAVDTINQGKIHIVEPELDMLVQTVVQAGHLRAAMEPEKADAFIITVPTPFKGDREPDLTYIESATRAISPVLEKGDMVVLESTSPVGATEKMLEWIREERPDLSLPEFKGDGSSVDITVAHCPERVLPGNIVRELVENDRIIGGVTTQCAERVRDFYKIFVQAECFITDCRTAELGKLVENSFRDVNIAFANELSLISDKLDINVWELVKLANQHPRVNILQPGPGVGGHCIAVDPWFIVNSAPDEAKLIRTARLVNNSKPHYVVKKIEQAVMATGRKISELSIGCFGLAFKPNIDDFRESPALEISQRVNRMKFSKQYLVEPHIQEIPQGFDACMTELVAADIAIAFSDIVVLLVDHLKFKAIDLDLLSGKQIVDTRGVWTVP